MKTNAIVRIVIYSLVILLLVGILLTCFGIGTFSFNINNVGIEDMTTGGSSVDASQVSKLQLDWAAGSITIRTADTDEITFTESGNFSDEFAMVCNVKGGELHIQYSKPAVSIGFVSTPSKDLVITVPNDWFCQELELDGAALEVDISGVSINELDIDGASNIIDFSGAVKTLDIDGASCDITLLCTDRPRKIDMDGASCRLDLTLPAECGFQVQMDGLSCDFYSDLDYIGSEGNYFYGDRYCQIDADGMSCELSIRQSE